MSVLTREELGGGVLLVTLDVPDKKVNTLARTVREELAALITELESRDDVRGLLFRSGKPGQFVAGADLNELGALEHVTKEQIQAELEGGHELFDRLSQLPFPTVALIDGNCMGGGTELVLAMDERLASNSPKTQIALPEVKIGLIPGWGGTQRMPRLIGMHNAIELICGGEGVSADRAAALGLAFDAVPADKLVEEGQRLIGILHENDAWKKQRARRSQPLGLSVDQLQFAGGVAEGHLRGKTQGHYPAPLAALKSILQGINLPLEAGLKVERQVAMEIMGSPIASNLIHVFFLNNAASRERGVSDPSIKPRPVRRVGVLGGGLMGAGIVSAHARQKIPTQLVEANPELLKPALQRVEQVVSSRIAIGRATPQDLMEMFTHINAGSSIAAFAECDVVIEAVPEKEELKKQVFQQIAEQVSDQCILASNTSTISITRMAEAVPHPERFAGLHFFYPVDRMQLVEVIRGEKTSDETVVTLVELSKQIKKVPIVVNDCPGFLVNRILLPYMSESLLMLVEGADMDAIDKASTRFGFPMGPIALHDLVGLDTAVSAGQVMVNAFGDRAVMTPLLGAMVRAGRLGKKSGAGFRQYVGKKQKPAPDPAVQPLLEQHRTASKQFTPEEITDRLILPMLVEATRILEEQVVKGPGEVDLGMILGTGFPPFRGGLLRWADSVGLAQIVKRLEKYAPLGKRFEPTALLRDMAARGGRFYGSAAK